MRTFLKLFMNRAQIASKTHLFLLGNQQLPWCLEVSHVSHVPTGRWAHKERTGEQHSHTNQTSTNWWRWLISWKRNSNFYHVCVIVCVWPDCSLDVPLLGPRWFLTSMLMAAALLVPALTLDSLLCYYCPLQHKAKPCTNITSQCLPNQRCSSSRGRYGSVHILSAQSCVDAQLCGSTEILSYRGVKYNVSHTCCCKDKCNGPPKSEASLKKLLGIFTDKTDVNVTNVLGEEPWDSCANYTSLSTSTLPAAAWKESL